MSSRRVASQTIGMAEHRFRVAVTDCPVLAGIRVLRAVLFCARHDVVLQLLTGGGAGGFPER